MQSTVFFISFGETSVRLICDNETICYALALHLRHCQHKGGLPVATYTITTLPAGYELAQDNGARWQFPTEDDLLLFLMTSLLTSLNGECRSGLLFHAACVAEGERGILISNASGAGKSTLAAWLVAEGFQYLTDEVVIASVEDHSLRGLARSVGLKRGSRFVVDQWVQADSDPGLRTFRDGSTWVDPELLHPNSVRTQAQPQLLIAPQYTPNTAFTALPMSAGQATFHLMQHLVNARNFPDHGLGATAQLARRVVGYSLNYSNCADAATWIKETLARL